MATYSHIPNPASISVKTAGYTIPANRYARAIINLIGSATFTINAVTALAGTQNNVLGSSALSYTTNGGATAPTLGYHQNAVTSVGSAFTAATDQKTTVQDVFLPPGTIIGGTGTWRAIIEEYTT